MEYFLPLQAFLLVMLVHTIGASLQGAIGYGMVLVSGPVLVLVEPRLMPGPYLVSSTLLAIMMILRERKELVLGDLVWAIGGRIPGSALAAALLAVVAESTISLAFGFIILAAVGLSVSGLRFPPNRVNLFTAGVLSGIMGTIAAIGGPPIAIVYQNEPGGRLRTNMSIFFLFGTLISIISLIPAGKFGTAELLLSLNLIPAVLLGFILSSLLKNRLNPRWTRSVVLGVAAVSALVVIVKQIMAP
jgi:uncharacterized membrane protein YfcA